MLSLFWTLTAAAAPNVAVPRYGEELQLFSGKGTVLLFLVRYRYLHYRAFPFHPSPSRWSRAELE